MTDNQFNRYKELKDEIAPLKEFLFWCGIKYHAGWISRRQMRIIKKKFCVCKDFGPIENNEVKLPLELQNRIIDVIEQYVDEKQKELDEI